MSNFQQQAQASNRALDAEQAAFDEEHIASLREDLDSAWKVLLLATEALTKASLIYQRCYHDLNEALARREGGK